MSKRRKRGSKAASAAGADRREAMAPPSAAEARSNPRFERAALVLWGLLLALVLTRGLLTLQPSMTGWGLNVQRFLDPLLAWLPWALTALSLAPPFARSAARWLERAASRLERAPVLWYGGWALGAVLLVWLTPDRVRFVGDFLLRQGTVEVAERPGLLFPQALPLDVFLHYTVPKFLVESVFIDANRASRLVGALEAGLLGVVAAAFPRVLSLRGSVAAAASAVLLFGGYLGMFTGYSKAFAEITLLTAAAGVLALRAVREGRGLLLLGLVVTVGLALHRSALGFLPAWALTWILWWRRHGQAGAWRRPGVLIALAVPIAALAVSLPRIIATVQRWDAVHFASYEVRRQGGLLRASLSRNRLLDVLNLTFMLSPLAVAAPLLAATVGPSRGRRWPELALLATLALPFVLGMLLIHPAQGMFRDWDDFAAAGVGLSLIAAWVIGEVLRQAPRFSWLPLAVTLSAFVPASQWLIHHTDVNRGLERVRSFMVEPPRRSGQERGNTWDYLGIRNYAFQRWGPAAEAWGHAAETAPSPRILQQWALAETMRDSLDRAQTIYYRVLEKDPGNYLAWVGLAAVSGRLRQLEESRRAVDQALRLRPGAPEAMSILRELDAYERAHRDSVGG